MVFLEALMKILHLFMPQGFHLTKSLDVFQSSKFIYSIKPRLTWYIIHSIEQKQGQRYKYTQLIHIRNKRKELYITKYCFIFLRRTDKIIYFQSKHTKLLKSFTIFHTNNQYSSFSIHTHQTYKEIQSKKHVYSKPKLLTNTLFRISRFRTTDIHPRTDRLVQ